MAARKSRPAKPARSSTALVRREPATAFPVPIASPFDVMRRFSEDMDRLFGRFAPWAVMPPFGEETTVGWAPQLDVFERDQELVVRADVPGLGPDDIKVEVTDEAVVIEGERKEEREEKGGSVYRSERSYGRFYRRVPLPEGAKADEAKATFKNGVLEVVMPAPERRIPQGRRIEVKAV